MKNTGQKQWQSIIFHMSSVKIQKVEKYYGAADQPRLNAKPATT